MTREDGKRESQDYEWIGKNIGNDLPFHIDEENRNEKADENEISYQRGKGKRQRGGDLGDKGEEKETSRQSLNQRISPGNR